MTSSSSSACDTGRTIAVTGVYVELLLCRTLTLLTMTTAVPADACEFLWRRMNDALYICPFYVMPYYICHAMTPVYAIHLCHCVSSFNLTGMLIYASHVIYYYMCHVT